MTESCSTRAGRWVECRGSKFGQFEIALGKAWKGGICDETVKLFIEIQLVQVQPGQSSSVQAGSECCHSPGDWRVRSVHSK